MKGGKRCRYGKGGSCEGESWVSISGRGNVARARVLAPNEVGGGRWIRRWLAVVAVGEANINMDGGDLCDMHKEGKKMKKEKE